MKHEGGTSLRLQSREHRITQRKPRLSAPLFATFPTLTYVTVLSSISEVGLALLRSGPKAVSSGGRSRATAPYLAASHSRQTALDTERQYLNLNLSEQKAQFSSSSSFFSSLGLKHDSSLGSFNAHVFLAIRIHLAVITYL